MTNDGSTLPSSSPSPGQIVLTLDDATESTINFQAFQALYNKMTGKTEKLTRDIADNYQLEFSDIEQLNHRILQTLDQYQVKARNCSILVEHDGSMSWSQEIGQGAKVYSAG